MARQRALATVLLASAVGVIVWALLRCDRRRTSSPPALMGNASSGVVHRFDCPSFDPSDDAPGFDSLAEAEAAGFRPCGICKP
jgi:methylphosphotriester-DNA--protein-cysteine methyltransferase